MNENTASVCEKYLPEGELGKTAENRFHMSSRRGLETACEKGAVVEAVCTLCDCSAMNLTVQLPDGIRGIIPRSEVCYNPDGGETKDIAVITRVGKPVQFKIRAFCDGGHTAILSRCDAQLECWERYISNMVPGDIIPAKVTHLEPFGAFCDIGAGVVSLITVDRISVSRISHPSDRFRVGDKISAVVASRDESGRICLTHRELLGTWAENAAHFAPGQTACGIIRSVEEYGVFVELAPNLAGLAELNENAKPGESCSVYIKSIIPERMKVKLVLVDTSAENERMPLKYYVDTENVHRMDRWQYSPDGCRKVVESVFGGGVLAGV